MSEVRKPRPGAVRWKDPIDHDYHVVEPGNAMYSSALMCAAEYWDAASDSWKPILADQDNQNA